MMRESFFNTYEEPIEVFHICFMLSEISEISKEDVGVIRWMETGIFFAFFLLAI